MNIKNILTVAITALTLTLTACGEKTVKGDTEYLPGEDVFIDKPELVVTELDENCNIFEGCQSLRINAPDKTQKINFNFMRTPERAVLLVDGNELLLDEVGFVEIPDYQDSKFILIVQQSVEGKLEIGINNYTVDGELFNFNDSFWSINFEEIQNVNVVFSFFTSEGVKLQDDKEIYLSQDNIPQTMYINNSSVSFNNIDTNEHVYTYISKGLDGNKMSIDLPVGKFRIRFNTNNYQLNTTINFRDILIVDTTKRQTEYNVYLQPHSLDAADIESLYILNTLEGLLSDSDDPLIQANLFDYYSVDKCYLNNNFYMQNIVTKKSNETESFNVFCADPNVSFKNISLLSNENIKVEVYGDGYYSSKSTTITEGVLSRLPIEWNSDQPIDSLNYFNLYYSELMTDKENISIQVMDLDIINNHTGDYKDIVMASELKLAAQVIEKGFIIVHETNDLTISSIGESTILEEACFISKLGNEITSMSVHNIDLEVSKVTPSNGEFCFQPREGMAIYLGKGNTFTGNITEIELANLIGEGSLTKEVVQYFKP